MVIHSAIITREKKHIGSNEGSTLKEEFQGKNNKISFQEVCKII